MYGEWLYAKHSIYYDKLPHYFLEFDIFDREQKIFLDTETRHNLLIIVQNSLHYIIEDHKFQKSQN